MTQTSPVNTGLVTSHRIITKAVQRAVTKCGEYSKDMEAWIGEFTGFSMYMTNLKMLTHSHHTAEDEILFPFYRSRIDAPWDRLKDDHQAISGILGELDKYIKEISAGGQVMTGRLLEEFNNIWTTHIRIEEENLTAEKLGEISDMEEQKQIVKKVADHGYKNSGPASTIIPFVMYTLDQKEQKEFLSEVPWFLKKILVPIVWKNKWKPMSPFFG
jgi:hemerythrin-like domain-containing protein